MNTSCTFVIWHHKKFREWLFKQGGSQGQGALGSEPVLDLLWGSYLLYQMEQKERLSNEHKKLHLVLTHSLWFPLATQIKDGSFFSPGASPCGTHWERETASLKWFFVQYSLFNYWNIFEDEVPGCLMVAELEITFCQSDVNPLTSSHILKTRQNYIEEGGKLYIKNVVLNYLTPFIYINTDIPKEGFIIRTQLK